MIDNTVRYRHTTHIKEDTVTKLPELIKKLVYAKSCSKEKYIYI